MSLAPPPFHAWVQMPPVWRRWFQSLFTRVGGSPDTVFAPLASPTFTGTPSAPTAAVGTNSTQLATTAFVLGQAASAAPGMDGSAAAGASTRYARADHVHPTDTSRAPLASPAFTGTPTAPTPAAGDSSTKVATTAFVATALSRATVDVTTGAPGSVAIVGAAANIASVSIVELTVPSNPLRVVRFTFSAAMPDTNYVAMAIHEWSSGFGDSWGQEFFIVAKETTYFDLATRDNTTIGGWTHVDATSHRFSVLVNR